MQQWRKKHTHTQRTTQHTHAQTHTHTKCTGPTGHTKLSNTTSYPGTSYQLPDFNSKKRVPATSYMYIYLPQESKM